MTKNLIFDLDDTLADCSIFYREQENKFVQYQHERTGLDVDIIKKLREDIDVNFTKTPDGFSRVRFPRSFASTSTVIDIMLGTSIDDVAAYHSFELGDEVFNAMYPLFSDTESILTQYKNSGHKLFLFTKGDFSVQTRKIELNQLHRWFDNECIYVVPQKTTMSLKRILDDHDLAISDTIVIGDSLRDDIKTGMSVGCTTVWVGGKHNTAWAYENTQIQVTHKIDTISELPMLIDPKTGNFTMVTTTN